MAPERIYDVLATGVMKPQGDQLTDYQKKMLATFLSGRPLGSLKEGDAKDMPNHCASNAPLDETFFPGPNGMDGARDCQLAVPECQGRGPDGR